MLQAQPIEIGAAAGGSDQIVESFLDFAPIDPLGHHNLISLTFHSNDLRAG